ncbi:probable membrane-associated kinase regulator 6 [Solanum lycopersicum]|uniref:probable membrane-associated kinase regulator 6 n=1 Tax=Solanum lycopersicum TaxID=4081 RepID=UPI003748BFE8
MENSQPPLATESFSYSWLLNRKPSIDGLTESPRPSYSDDDHDNDDEEEDMKFIAYSKRFLEEAQNFNFDVHPVSESVHADEIFSHGHIMPRYLDKSKIESFREALNNFNIISSVPSSSSFHPTPRVSDSTTSTQADDFLKKWRRFSRRVLVKWFGFIRPISKRISSSRKSTAKVDDLQRKVSEIQSCKATDSPPHRIMKSHSVVDWAGNRNDQTSRVKTLRKVKSWSSIKSPQAAYNSPVKSPSYDHSAAVSDAILHCKRSFGMVTEPDINLDDHFDSKKHY